MAVGKLTGHVAVAAARVASLAGATTVAASGVAAAAAEATAVRRIGAVTGDVANLATLFIREIRIISCRVRQQLTL